MAKDYPQSTTIICPAAQAPLRGSYLFSYRERVRLLRHCFQKELAERMVKLALLERRMPKPNYTLITLREIEKRCGVKPIVVLGADQAQRLRLWYQFETLIQEFSFVIFARGHVPELLPQLHCRFIADFCEPVSATEIREKLVPLPPPERWQAALQEFSNSKNPQPTK